MNPVIKDLVEKKKDISSLVKMHSSIFLKRVFGAAIKENYWQPFQQCNTFRADRLAAAEYPTRKVWSGLQKGQKGARRL